MSFLSKNNSVIIYNAFEYEIGTILEVKENVCSIQTKNTIKDVYKIWLFEYKEKTVFELQKYFGY